MKEICFSLVRGRGKGKARSKRKHGDKRYSGGGGKRPRRITSNEDVRNILRMAEGIEAARAKAEEEWLDPNAFRYAFGHR